MNRIKTLSNKLKMVTSPMPHMESISVGIWIGMGGRYEGKRHCGVSHFIEHMLFKGTKTRDARQLKQAIEGVGGHFNGFTADEITCYLVKIPAPHISLGIDILTDMILHPKMKQDEIEKEKYVVYEEIKMYKDQPASYVQEILADIMWPEHPLGRPLTGFEDTVMGLDRKTLLNIKEKFYLPSNIAIVATGRLDEDKLFKIVQEKAATRSNNDPPNFKRFKISQKEKGLRLHFKDTEQTHIAMGFHSFGRESKKRRTLDLLHIILGGNMSSRLFEELREKRALCYDVSSSVKKYEETGAFFIHAGIDNKKVGETLAAIMKELSIIKTKPVSVDELKRAKEFYKGQLLLALEDTGSRMLWLGDKVMMEDKIPSVESILTEVEKVTREDIRDVADEVFQLNIMNLAAIGPEGSLKDSEIKKLMEFK